LRDDDLVVIPEKALAPLFEQAHEINVKLLADGDDDPYPLILLEADKSSLEFLGQVLIAVARDDEHCGFQFGPHHAGSAHFSRQSQFGLYLHRLPCTHEMGPDDADQ